MVMSESKPSFDVVSLCDYGSTPYRLYPATYLTQSLMREEMCVCVCVSYKEEKQCESEVPTDLNVCKPHPW